MKQDAGRKALADLAPKFAELNDDVLFGEVWSRVDKLDLKTRCIVTLVCLLAKGITDNSLKYHIDNAKRHGVSKVEMVEIITHAAFYLGWPNAWAVFPLVRAAYAEDKAGFEPMFGLGEPNEEFAQHFDGQSYLNPLNEGGIRIDNVTFSPGCRNHWHVHRAEQGGGQILLITDGEGYYQEWGKPARKLHPGDVVCIAPMVKHWHGASKDEWFAHLSLEVDGLNCHTEWLEKVNEEDYQALK